MKMYHLFAIAAVLSIFACSKPSVDPQEKNTEDDPIEEPVDTIAPVHDPLEDDVPNPFSYIVGGQECDGERIRMEYPGIANPERGFRFEILVGIEGGESTENKWPFPDYKDDGVTITQAYCYLTDYFDCPIAQSKLDALQASFDRARQDGVKFLLRFAYQDDDHKANAPTVDQLMSHIEQLTPIIRENIDVVYVLQIGWIGMWGEFHSDPYNYNVDNEAIARIAKATLELLPQSRSTMMRTMGYRTRAFKGAEKLGFSLQALRIGFFNDGTLANGTDGGTFGRSDEKDKDFVLVNNLSANFPVDGECYWNSVATYDVATGMKAIQRFYKHHYCTFSCVHGNSELERHKYGPIDCWKSVQVKPSMLREMDVPVDDNYYKQNPHPNAYEYIRDHLGYRFEVLNYQGKIENGTFNGKVVIRNTGFAKPVNPRDIYLVLFDQGGNVIEVNTGVDARTLMPWKEVEINLTANGIPEGYKAALWLPDPENSVHMRPEYAVTIAYGTKSELIGDYLLNVLE